MARQRLDPDYPDAVNLGTKLGRRDAEKIIELANEAGATRSQYLRTVLLDHLEHGTGPPDGPGG
jgi:hypothetical protein